MSSTPITIYDYNAAIRSGLIPASFTEDRLALLFRPIQTLDAHGHSIHWQIRVELLDVNGQIVPIETAMLIHHDPSSPSASPLPTGYTSQTIVDSGRVEGKTKAVSPTIITVGKNLGRKNATNVLTQAIRDAFGKHLHQANKARMIMAKRETMPVVPVDTKKVITKYVRVLPDVLSKVREALIDHLYQPMLIQAEGHTQSTSLKDHEFTDEGEPLVVQRKYDGLRIVTFKNTNVVKGAETGRVYLYSRGCFMYPGFEYLREELQQLFDAAPPMTRELIAFLTDRAVADVSEVEETAYSRSNGSADVYIDGEIYKHGVPLPVLSGLARSQKDVPENLEYHVFDCFFPKAIQAGYSMSSFGRQRYIHLIADAVGQETPPHLRWVANFPVRTREQLSGYVQQFLSEGYEGAVVRRPQMPYIFSEHGRHVSHVLKIKPIEDKEFTIVGYTDGKGKNKGLVTWVCEVPKTEVVNQKDKTFCVEPKDITMRQRSVIFKHLGEIVQAPDGGQTTRFDRDVRGQQLTVEFRCTSVKTGKPFQPKAKTIRAPEDNPRWIDPLKMILREFGDPEAEADAAAKTAAIALAAAASLSGAPAGRKPKLRVKPTAAQITAQTVAAAAQTAAAVTQAVPAEASEAVSESVPVATATARPASARRPAAVKPRPVVK
jgi:ATP-dependent DNA ligase